jgi:hypothetical protein
MEGGVVGKETDRIVKEILKNGAPTYRATVAVTNFEDFRICVTNVAQKCPAVSVMFGTFVGEAIYFALAVAPSVPADVKNQWLSKSLDIVSAQQLALVPKENRTKDNAEIVDNIWIPNTTVHVARLVLTAKCELTTEKLLDQIFGVASAFAKKSGLVPEEEEEKEYNFDDI